MQTVACFDVWGTLIIPDREGFIKHICEHVSDTLRRYGIEVRLDKLVKAFSEADREVRERRRRECSLIPPEECVRVFLEKVLGKGVSLDIVDDVEDTICRAVETSPHVRPADAVLDVLSMFRNGGHRLAIVSNIVFWRSSATRRVLRRFGLSMFDLEVYADVVKEVKPSTRMLRIVENLLNSKVIIHVGDSLFEDVAMAIAYNVPAVFIDRKGQILNENERFRLELGGRVVVVRELKDLLKVDLNSLVR
ncbi:MAG: HAD family hydrolase [Crenarchaeota archaeon]|nr:HAD family hydrolase [Thermoproteota archaeon]